ncbi:MAG TPA: FUSC family protein [Solirubrobacteraceae bacterium]|nr:FUSC family protein [Solirubrobacteraceae bacterium]
MTFQPQSARDRAAVKRAAELLDEAATRSRTTARGRLARLRDLAPTLAQTALAAGGAWLAAVELIGHQQPFFAPIAAVVVLGVTRGRHARRAVELAIGVALGICVAELIVHHLGGGALTIVLVVALAMAAAVALGGDALLVSQAAISATLVATLGGEFTLARAVDALAGGAAALAVGFLLLPIDPVRPARTAAGTVLDELALLLADLAGALESRDREAVVDALLRARTLEHCHDAFSEAATTGLEIATYSPLRRRARPALQRYEAAAAQVGLALNNVRVMARGALRAVELEDNVPPDVIDAVRDLAATVRALAPAIDDPQRASRARQHAVHAAALATLSLERTANLSTSSIVAQVRSTALDLLRGLGDDREAAASAIRSAARDVAQKHS